MLMPNFDQLIELVRSIGETPQPLVRDENLLAKAKEMAKQEIVAAFKKSQSLCLERPGRLSAHQSELRSAQKRVDAALQRTAEKIYLNLDPEFARALEKQMADLDARIRQFDVWWTPIRDWALSVEGVGEVHEFLKKQLPVADYSTEAGGFLPQEGWQEMWREQVPRILHDLQRIKHALLIESELNARAAGQELTMTAADTPQPGTATGQTPTLWATVTDPADRLVGSDQILEVLRQPDDKWPWVMNLNKVHAGPIKTRKGSKNSIASKAALLRWWPTVESLYNQSQARENDRAALEDHSTGNADLAPDIGGHWGHGPTGRQLPEALREKPRKPR